MDDMIEVIKETFLSISKSEIHIQIWNSLNSLDALTWS